MYSGWTSDLFIILRDLFLNSSGISYNLFTKWFTFISFIAFTLLKFIFLLYTVKIVTLLLTAEKYLYIAFYLFRYLILRLSYAMILSTIRAYFWEIVWLWEKQTTFADLIVLSNTFKLKGTATTMATS